VKFLLVLLLAACGAFGAGQTRPKPTTGAITGLVRDKATIEPLASAEVLIAGKTSLADKAGIYLVDHLAPGRYTLSARYAGKTITIKNIEVVRGMASYVDVSIGLDEPDPEIIDWTERKADAAISYFATSVPRIEGTVSDSATHGRVGGAVVTATDGYETYQTVTDDHGRYRFDAIVPATYAISAYYSIGGRGQIEVRRSDIVIEAGKGAFVPLSIELAKQ
jgi:hypothetical protein